MRIRRRRRDWTIPILAATYLTALLGSLWITTDNDESAVGEREDEEMWKDRAEQAEAEVMRLRGEVARLGRVLNDSIAARPAQRGIAADAKAEG